MITTVATANYRSLRERVLPLDQLTVINAPVRMAAPSPSMPTASMTSAAIVGWGHQVLAKRRTGLAPAFDLRATGQAQTRADNLHKNQGARQTWGVGKGKGRAGRRGLRLC